MYNRNIFYILFLVTQKTNGPKQTLMNKDLCVYIAGQSFNDNIYGLKLEAFS